MNSSRSKTRLSLLGALRKTPEDPETWKEFVLTYGPQIKRWCRGWGLQSNDADDVTQDVLLAMARQMKDFKYDANGRFRSWLKTVAYRAWVDFLKRRSRAVQGSGSDAVQDLISSIEVQEDFLQKMEAECETSLLETAMLLVRRRVNERTWLIFQKTALDGVSGSNLATELGIPITAVYKAKSRVQKMLKAEVENLDQSRIES